MNHQDSKYERNKSAADVAADLFIYMPVGIAVEVGKHLPLLAKQGRDLLEGPLKNAKGFSHVAMQQGKRDFEQRFKKATSSDDSRGPQTEPHSAAEAGSEPSDTDLPIHGYASLSVVEILDHLARLEAIEIERIRDHELRHLNRTAVLERCEELLRTSGS